MPKFVIERQYLVPMYQHIVVEAENLEGATFLYENEVETGPLLDIPEQFTDEE